VIGGERIGQRGRDERGEINKMLNKLTILQLRMYKSGGPLAAPQTPNLAGKP
jgi:hypothetical protein